MFLLWLRQLPWSGDWTPAFQFARPPRAEPVLLTLLFSPLVPSSYGVLHGSIYFSTGQVFLSTLSWCSTRTCVSEGVFLMYPWREMYSTSTYSFDIFFSFSSFLKDAISQFFQAGNLISCTYRRLLKQK